MDVIIPSSAAPLGRVEIRKRNFWVKRDDQWRLSGELGGGISGNKARKLLHFAVNRTSTAPIVASMGGHQSNACVAMAALCRARGLRMLYLCKPVPRWLRKNPAGNYARGLALGVELVPLQPEVYRRCTYDVVYRDQLLQQLIDDDDQIEWLPQGAAYVGAEYGISILAQELAEAFQGSPLRVVLPGGTGTTALFLARHLVKHAPNSLVFCVPCGTTAKGLEVQMQSLDKASGGHGIFPIILDDPNPKFRFGTPSDREWRIWNEIKDAGLFLELLYAPHTWDIVLRALGLDSDPDIQKCSMLCDDDADNIVYLHCGGIEGVATQLTRYRRAGFHFDDDDDDDELLLTLDKNDGLNTVKSPTY